MSPEQTNPPDTAMPPDPQRQALLRALADGAPRRLRALSRALGRNDAYLHQYLYRGSPRRLPEDIRHHLARLLGVDEQLLRVGQIHSTPQIKDHMQPQIQADRTGRIVHIPLLELAVSAGGGSFDYVAEEAAPPPGWPFDRDMLGAIFDGAPETLRLVQVRGESMSPALEDGDMVLVNTADKRPSPPGIFVLYDGVGLVVKALELIPAVPSGRQMIRISSANPHYSAYQRGTDEIDIKGRIIWFGRRLSR